MTFGGLMSKYFVIYYEDKNGVSPILNFIEEMNLKHQAKIIRTIELLEVNGPALREPFSKYIGDNLFELRIIFGSDISRIIYFFIKGKEIILVHAFKKKTDKISRLDMNTARMRRDWYLKNKEK